MGCTSMITASCLIRVTMRVWGKLGGLQLCSPWAQTTTCKVAESQVMFEMNDIGSWQHDGALECRTQGSLMVELCGCMELWNLMG